MDKAFKIIEDVMLDIVMYNSLIAPNYDSTIEAKRAFSQMKINFINKLKLHSEDWNTDKHKGYIAIAGYFWNKDYFDYAEYINCWLKIKQELFQEDEIVLVVYSLREQLKRYVDVGELSIRKVEKMFEKLPKGEYLLVRLFKVPKERQNRKFCCIYLEEGFLIERK
ncbi:hypothetical protein SFC43_13340 [Bacteroides sp. CR5/BHMF/2]|nr:hypothetical protein [Bacteroides sp. CR5/BHMF/2]